MQRAESVLREARHHLDAWIEVADARAPVSSRLPWLRRVLERVPGALVLTHADLADRSAVAAWCRVLDQPCFALNAKAAPPAALLNWLQARMGRPPLRLFVAGMPNVGKSTLVNRLAGSRSAAVGARPGVTRAEQWIRRGDLALLDLPGILPKRPTLIAAAIGLVPEEDYDPEEAARAVLEALPGPAAARYDVVAGERDGLAAVARRHSLLLRGGELDIGRAGRTVLQDLRQGRLRPAQLEWPSDGS
jgi:ribosome biogenesis GTPase A